MSAIYIILDEEIEPLFSQQKQQGHFLMKDLSSWNLYLYHSSRVEVLAFYTLQVLIAKGCRVTSQKTFGKLSYGSYFVTLEPLHTALFKKYFLLELCTAFPNGQSHGYEKLLVQVQARIILQI